MATPPTPNVPVNIPINLPESMFLQAILLDSRDGSRPTSRTVVLLVQDIVLQIQKVQGQMAVSGDGVPVPIAISQQESEFLQNTLVYWRSFNPQASSTELDMVASLISKLQAVQAGESQNQIKADPNPDTFGQTFAGDYNI